MLPHRYSRRPSCNLLSLIFGIFLFSPTTPSAGPPAGTCPPETVSSEELTAYCTNSFEITGDKYECHNPSCQGTIDNSLLPPPCSRNITSCSSDSYNELCVYNWRHKFCASRSWYDFSLRDDFACWDKEADQWCKGYIAPPVEAYENDTCPDYSLEDCQDLVNFAAFANLCNCYKEVDSTHHFKCYHYGDTEPWCTGTIGPVRDNKCPPLTVSSEEEMMHYCPDGGQVSTMGPMGKFYDCDTADGTHCHGRLDYSLAVPECSLPTIASCSDEHYLETCAPDPGPYRFCGQREITDRFSTVANDFARDDFQCWDVQANQWCKGTIVPPAGSYEKEICPMETLPSCNVLKDFINASVCDCSENENDVASEFKCYHYGSKQPWCKGTVQVPNKPTAMPTSTEFATLEGSQEGQPTSSEELPSVEDSSFCTSFVTCSMVPVLVLVAVFTIVLTLRRRGAAGRKGYSYNIASGVGELELQSIREVEGSII